MLERLGFGGVQTMRNIPPPHTPSLFAAADTTGCSGEQFFFGTRPGMAEGPNVTFDLGLQSNGETARVGTPRFFVGSEIGESRR